MSKDEMLVDALSCVIITFQWRETKSHCGSKQKSVEPLADPTSCKISGSSGNSSVTTKICKCLQTTSVHVCIFSDIEVLSSL